MMTGTQTVRKNAIETIHIRRTEFNGVELLDVRAYAERPAGGPVPTKKGLSLRLELWRELLPLIEQALAEVNRETAAAA